MAYRIKISDIIELSSNALLGNGLSEDDTSTVLAHLLDGELSGKASHGFYRLPSIVRLIQKKGVSTLDITYENDTQTSALLNGQERIGLVVAQKANQNVEFVEISESVFAEIKAFSSNDCWPQ